MQKTYIFRTKDGKEYTIRGSKGQRFMEVLEKDKQTAGINLGGIVTTIGTKFETQEELLAELTDV